MNPSFLAIRAVIAGAIGITLMGLWITLLVRARGPHDPDRIWVKGLKWLLPLVVIASILTTVGDAFGVIGGGDYRGYTPMVAGTTFILRAAENFFAGFGDIVLLAVFVKLGISLMYTLEKQKVKSEKTLRRITMTGVWVLAILQTFSTGYGLVNRRFMRSFDPSLSSETEHHLRTTMSLLFCVSSTCTATYAGRTMRLCRNVDALRTTSKFFFASTALNLPRWIQMTTYYISRYGNFGFWEDNNVALAYMVFDLVLDKMFFFVALVLLYVVGLKPLRSWTRLEPRAKDEEPITMSERPRSESRVPCLDSTALHQLPDDLGGHPHGQLHAVELDGRMAPQESDSQTIHMMGSPVRPPRRLEPGLAV